MLFGRKILVYCTSQISKTNFYEFISTLNEELVKNNWRILIFCTESDLSKDNLNTRGDVNLFELINYDIADAILISNERIQDTDVKNSILNNAKKRNIPVFMFDGERSDTYNIKFDQKHSFKKIVKHIVEQHEVTSLHFMAGFKNNVQSDLRLEAFKEILARNNIPFDDSMVSYGDFWEVPCRAATQKLIDEKRVPRAIICANDAMAITVIEVLTSNGYNCPRDVIVTGFDGIDTIAYCTPKISSVVCDFRSLAIETANYIFEITEHPQVPDTRLVDGSLLISESCGCNSITPSDSLKCITTLTNAYARYRHENTILGTVSTTIHASKNVDELINNLKDEFFYNCMCIVKAECIDETLDPNVSHTKTAYGEDLFVLMDSDYKDGYTNRYIKSQDLIPRIEELLTYHNIPLIFTPLNNLDLPLGYLMFSFQNYDKQNYARVNQIASWIGNAITAYRNSQYQQQLQKKIESMYSHDSLTGLYNRNGFLRIYNDILNDPDVKVISLAMCDLDNLKHINDNFSHSEGDNAIRIVGNALSTAISKGYFCRYGGDEIIGLYTSKIDAEELENKVNLYIDEYNKDSNKPYKVSTSLGLYTSSKTSFEEMFAKADELMYQQKIHKKNRRK